MVIISEIEVEDLLLDKRSIVPIDCEDNHYKVDYYRPILNAECQLDFPCKPF